MAPRFESRSFDRGSESRSSGRIERGTVQRGSVERGSVQRDWRGNVQRGSVQRGNVQRGSVERGMQRGGTARQIESRAAGDRFHHVDGWNGRSGVAPYRAHERVQSFGRVDRVVRVNNGFHVFIRGGLFPIFVPFHRFRVHPIHVGLFLGFGGFWDPLGFWSVYDYWPYGPGYYGPYGYGYYPPRYDTGYTSGQIRGVVESVDFSRGTMVINDDVSHQFVTLSMPNDRRLDSVREGDYVEFSGDWTRNGVFYANHLDRLDYGRDGRDGRDRDYNRDDRY
ncbi:MAG TPA: hypothetical protein VF980_03140 [Thermoanaerobaculia bacterium]